MKLAFLLFFIIVGINGQSSPCVNVFQYNYKENEWYGTLLIPSNGKSQLELKLILTMPGIPSKNNPGQIVLQDSIESVIETIEKRGNFRFKVVFPTPGDYPQVNSILLNGQEICHGPKVPPTGSKISLGYLLDTTRATSTNDRQEFLVRPKPIVAQYRPEYAEQNAPENEAEKNQFFYESEPKQVITTSTTTNTSSTITTVNKITNSSVTTISRA